MDTNVLKEPRGFMRMLQWFFAIVAFSCCAHFSTSLKYEVECSDGSKFVVSHNVSYPFVPSDQVASATCGKSDFQQLPPGDFSHDAVFFVFTGVVSFLATMALLFLYVFMAPIYESESKKPPMIDFLFTVIIAVFWLSASAAWANGLVGLKSVFSGAWIFAKDPSQPSVCEMNSVGFTASDVVNCKVVDDGHFAGANVSVLVGFLNFFLWSANLWFLYKETPWFAGRQQPAQTLEG